MYLDLARWLKKMEHTGDGDTYFGGCTLNNHQMIGKGSGRQGIKRSRRDDPNYSMIRSAKILRRILETWWVKTQWKTFCDR